MNPMSDPKSDTHDVEIAEELSRRLKGTLLDWLVERGDNLDAMAPVMAAIGDFAGEAIALAASDEWSEAERPKKILSWLNYVMAMMRDSFAKESRVLPSAMRRSGPRPAVGNGSRVTV
jgi:hypothetical protein